MKVTYRQCANLANTAEELKARGGFKFRCAIASVALEAKNKIEIFNEAQKPSKGIQAFNDEVSLYRENCTSEIDGKKVIDVPSLMVLYNKAKEIHKHAIEQAEKNQTEANKAFDMEIEMFANPIPLSLLEETDNDEHFEISILSRLLPFVE